MICTWEGIEGLDLSHAVELWDSNLHCRLIEDGTVEVPVSTNEVVISLFRLVYLLLAEIEDDTSIILGIKAFGVQQSARFEEYLDKVVGNFFIF
jgi:hypothetical protein